MILSLLRLEGIGGWWSVVWLFCFEKVEGQGKESGFYRLKEKKTNKTKSVCKVYKKGKEEHVLQVYGDYGSS